MKSIFIIELLQYTLGLPGSLDIKESAYIMQETWELDLGGKIPGVGKQQPIPMI